MYGQNPILPLQYHIPDCEAHVMPDGKVYLYGSFDKTADGFSSEEYVVFGSKDMMNWDIAEDSAFTTRDVPWAKNTSSKSHTVLSKVKCYEDLPAHIRQILPESARQIPIEQIVAAIEAETRKGLSKDIRLYAPDAIEKDGKYYLYFCMSDDSEGVAVSDKPTGPFKSAVKLPISGIDPAVFVDDDGAAYYYWGQFSANAAKLTPDMMSLDESTIVEGIVTEQKHHFHEGSSVRKRGDTYYYVFADTSRGSPTCLGYATSKSPLGPFTYQGVIVDNEDCDPKSWNNHGSIEKIGNQWYVFYHRSSGNSQYMRRVCCEPISFDENGLIPEVKMTSQGAGTPLKLGIEISASLACGFKGGAYLAEKDYIVLPVGGSALFRYVEAEYAPTRVWLSDSALKEQVELTCKTAENMRYEITLTNKGAGTLNVDGFVLE